MDNFHFVDVKPTIDRAQTVSIKEAIYKRAREKANALISKKNDDCTEQIQNDIMESAHESIRETACNPFNRFLENISVNPTDTEVVQDTEKYSNTTDIEEIFTREVKKNIESATNSDFVNSIKEETMKAAREQFSQNFDFTATLKFLNTQAAIRMTENAHSKIDYFI